MKQTTEWTNQLSDILTLSTDEVQQRSSDYDFYEIAGFDPNVLRLAIYRHGKQNVWDLAFQQRKDVWHSVGNFFDHPFKEMLGELSSSWRDDMEFLKQGFDTPVEWIKLIAQRA